MGDSPNPFYLIRAVIIELPCWIFYAVGIVVALKNMDHYPKASKRLLSGMLLMLSASLFAVFYWGYLEYRIFSMEDIGTPRYELALIGVGIGINLVYILGLSLLVAAIFAERAGIWRRWFEEENAAESEDLISR